MNARVRNFRMIEVLAMPPCPYLAVYRDALGRVTSQRALRPPLSSADDALEEAKRLAGAGEIFCDVFEIVETARVGGLRFTEE